MEYFYNSFTEAIQLLITGDGEVYRIVLLSLLVSFSATFFASLIAIPLGLLTGIKNFKFKKTYTRLLYTLMGLPPVVVGLIVAIMLSRRGLLGRFELLYTSKAMIIAQVLLVTPIITGIIFNHAKVYGSKICKVCYTLGGSSYDALWLLIREMRVTMLIAIVTGFGRAISEVGAVMIVGGNIKYHTRVMTTYIAMNNGMGNYAKALAMGIVLLLISFTVNSILYNYGMGEQDEY
jgi:tungstate transport system permease protein